MKNYVALAATILAMTATQASAAQFTFDFVTTSTLFGGPDQNGNGIFTTSDTATTVNGQTAFAITGISGQINGQAITGLANVVGITNYNYFTTGPTFLDGTGVRFDTATFKDIVFFAQDGVANPFRIRGNGTILANVNATSAAVAAVPEPATWAMTILGFGVIGLALRRRQKPVLRVAHIG